MEKEKAKRLTIELAQSDHTSVKRRSLEQNMSMKEWVLQAIKDQIQKEISLGWKE